MQRGDIIYLSILNGAWIILLLEHIVLNLELALPLAIIWGIGTMLFNIKVIAKYAIFVTYEDC